VAADDNVMPQSKGSCPLKLPAIRRDVGD